MDTGKRTTVKAVVAVLVTLAVLEAFILIRDLIGAGTPPKYAHAADPDALIYTEVSGERGVWIRRLAESRFVADPVREDLRTVLEQMPPRMPRHLGTVLFTLFGPGLNGAVRTAMFSTEVEYDEDDPFDVDEHRFALILEFRDREALEAVAQDLRVPGGGDFQVVDGNLLVLGERRRDLLRVAGRLKEGAVEGSLAETEAMAEACRVNEGEGLFFFLNGRELWKQGLSQMERAAQRDRDRGQANFVGDVGTADVVAAVRQLLPVESVGGTGLWLGVGEARAVSRLDGAPFLEAGLFEAGKGESLLRLLPDTTMLFIRFGLFEDSIGESLEELRDDCPAFGDLNDRLRDALRRESRGRFDPDGMEEHFKDLVDRTTGGFVLAWVDLGSGRGATVLLAETDERDAAAAAFRGLLASLGEGARVETEEVELRGMPVFRLGGGAILAFHDEAVILFDPEGRGETPAEERFLRYLKRCEDSPLPGSSVLESAGRGDVDTGAAVFLALHPHAIARNSDEMMARWRDEPPGPREEDDPEPGNRRRILRGPIPERVSGSECMARDEWVGVSVEIGGDGIEIVANFGYDDLLAISALDGYERMLYRSRCYEAVDTEALLSVIRMAQEQGERIHGPRDLNRTIDRDSQEVLNSIGFEIEEGGVLVLTHPITNKQTRLPIQ